MEAASYGGGGALCVYTGEGGWEGQPVPVSDGGTPTWASALHLQIIKSKGSTGQL